MIALAAFRDQLARIGPNGRYPDKDFPSDGEASIAGNSANRRFSGVAGVSSTGHGGLREGSAQFLRLLRGMRLAFRRRVSMLSPVFAYVVAITMMVSCGLVAVALIAILKSLDS